MIAILIKTCGFGSPRVTWPLSHVLALLETSAPQQHQGSVSFALLLLFACLTGLV